MLTDRRTEELLEKEEALDRLRKNLYHLWKTLKEVREDPTLPQGGGVGHRKAPRSGARRGSTGRLLRC